MSDEMSPTTAVPAAVPARVSRRRIAAILVLAIVSIAAFLVFGIRYKTGRSEPPQAGTAEQQAEATAAALEFLAVVDAGDYERTWVEAGPLLRQTDTKIGWLMLLRTSRAALGDLRERKRLGVGFVSKVRGGPPGRYAGVAFEGRFANTTVQEHVPLQFHDGQWKITGYHIKKNIPAPGSAGR